MVPNKKVCDTIITNFIRAKGIGEKEEVENNLLEIEEIEKQLKMTKEKCE